VPPVASSQPAPRQLQALKRAICERARDFEIASLLDLLVSMGYRPAEVWFRGHLTEEPQPTLLHHIAFAEADGAIAGPAEVSGPALDLGSYAELAEAHSLAAAGAKPAAGARPPGGSARLAGEDAPVTVTVNLGLLSCRSPLPSYFQRLLRDASMHEPLVELLRIIDRNLLRARLTCDRPERIVAQWPEVTKDLLRIHGLDSLVGLCWLFRHVFPELEVQVERTAEQLRVPYAAARLGSSELGSASFGWMTRIDVHDFQVTLTCEESLQRPQVPWLEEVRRRLRAIVFPALEPVCMNLTIVLELRDDDAVAVLHDGDGPAPESYLGQDPLGRPGGGGLPARKVVLYRGLLPSDQPDTDELEQGLVHLAKLTVTAPGRGRARTAPDGEEQATRLLFGQHELDHLCELELLVEQGRQALRYQATVRWGARAWFREEPYAMELRGDQRVMAPPTARHHPQLWAALRDHGRRALAAALADAALTHYGAAAVTEAMVADLLARGLDGAVHALLAYGRPSDVPRAAWDRFLGAQR
jgi:hypothetical protein